LSVDDRYRGRVMSFYTLMHQGTATFGSLGIGLLADRYGTPMGLLAGALVCLLAAVAWVASGSTREARHGTSVATGDTRPATAADQ
jgi:hypothetical protein